MRRGPIGVAAAVIVVGLLLLKGVGSTERPPMVVAPDNGGPRGLLALATWLRGPRGLDVVVHDDEQPHAPAGDQLVIIPPPEAQTMREDAAHAVALGLERGAHVVVLCDEDNVRNRRLQRLFSVYGFQCLGGDGPAADATSTVVAPGSLRFLVHSDLSLSFDAAWAVPYVFDQGQAAVATRRVGAGRLTVLSNGALVENDGLGEGQNAAYVLGLVQGRNQVVIDTSHHRLRQSRAAAAAFGRAGPMTGFLCLLLLVLCAGLMLFPRAGDPVPGRAVAGAAPAADVYALAALYRRAGLADDDAPDQETP